MAKGSRCVEMFSREGRLLGRLGISPEGDNPRCQVSLAFNKVKQMYPEFLALLGDGHAYRALLHKIMLPGETLIAYCEFSRIAQKEATAEKMVPLNALAAFCEPAGGVGNA